MKKKKVVQIGIGHDHAMPVLDRLLAHPEIFGVAALGIPEKERKAFPDRVARYEKIVPVMSPEDALELSGVDAAVIETEEINLTRYAILAAKKGLPIHMDKPGGLELGAFEELIHIVRTNRSVFHLGYMYRYNDSIAEAVRKAKSGELGEIYSVEAQMNCWHVPEKRQWLSQFPGGMMFYLGCHLVDLILQIMGEPEEIIPMNVSTGIDGVTSADYGFALFRYPRGVAFAKTCTTELGGFLRRQLVICGSKGTMELRPLEQYCREEELVTGIRSVTEENGRDWYCQIPTVNSAAINRYDRMLESFAKMVCGDMENQYGYDYELTLYKTLLRACGVEMKER